MASFEEIEIVSGGVTKKVGSISPDRPMTSAPSTTAEGFRRIRELEREARVLLYNKTQDPIHFVTAKINYYLLDRVDKERILNELNELTGISQSVEEYGVSLYKDFERAHAAKSKAFGRIPIDLSEKISRGEVTAEDLRIASLSFTHSMSELQTSVGGLPTRSYASFYKPGSTRFSQEFLNQQADVINQIKGDTADFFDRYVVFDIETPGLQKEKGIFEYAARAFETQAGDVTEVDNVFFRTLNPYMRSGEIFKEGRMVTPAQFMDEVLSAANVPIIDEAQGIKNILSQLERSNWTIVGQNVDFDIERILSSARNLPDFVTDVELRRLVEEFEDALIHGRAKIVDTLMLSMANFGENVEIAQELMDRATFTKHSIENVLAQTDVLEYALNKGYLTRDDLQEIFSGAGTHIAKNDTRLTNLILRYHIDVIQGRHTPSFRPQEATPDFLQGLSPNARYIEEQIRPKVFGGAVAPRIPLAIDQIAPDILDEEFLGPKLAPPKGQLATLSINPEEQSAILSRIAFSRQNVNRPVSTTALPEMARTFRSVIGQFYDDRGAATQGDLASLSLYEQMQAYRQRLIDANIPFSHLSMAEMQATASMQKLARGNEILFSRLQDAQVTSRFATSIDDIILRQIFAGQFGDVMPDAFMELSGPAVFKSGVASLPLEFVEEALKRRVSFLETSILPSEFKRVSFNVGLNEQDLIALQEALENKKLLEQFVISGKQAEDISRALGTRERMSVQVASISGEDAPGAFAQFQAIQENLRGEITDVSAGNRSPFGVLLTQSREEVSGTIGGQQRRFMNIGPMILSAVAESENLLEQDLNLAEDAAEKINAVRASIINQVANAAGIPSDQGLDPELMREALRIFNETQVGTTGSIREGLGQAVKGAANEQEVADILLGRRATGSITEEAMRRNAVLKRYGKATAIGAAVALSGYFIYKRAKENSKINETVETQEYEEELYNSFRPEAPDYDTGNPLIPVTSPIAQNSQSRRLEYMQTAGTTRRLWNRRTGHTNMGNDRYSHLYGG